MYKFSEKSKEKLAQAHPMLQCLFNEVIKYWDITITTGYRGEAAQNEAYANGTSSKRYPYSKHNKTPFSHAVDIAPYSKGGIDWNDDGSFYMLAGYVKRISETTDYMGLTISEYLRCGADWDGDREANDQGLRDPAHFELINVDEIDRLTTG